MRHYGLAPVPPPRYDEAVPKFETLLSSETRGWNSLQLYSYQLAPQPEPVAIPIIPAHTIQVIQQGRGRMAGAVDGRAVREDVYPGIMSLTPYGVAAAHSWTHGHVVPHLYLSPDLVQTCVQDVKRTDADRVALVPTAFFQDPFIEQVCLALVNELASGGPLGALYADTLAQVLALHLLRRYSSLRGTRDLPELGLSPRHLRLACDYIDDFLSTEISLNDLAALTGLSPAAFAKGFKRATGLPPHQYLIHRRVERAKELLADATLTVAEVAQVVGFFDQSHLIRHFKYWVGVTPSGYRSSLLSP